MAGIASAKERIENTPEIAKKEMAWYKGRSGELRPAAVDRCVCNLSHKLPLESDRMFIHTHVQSQSAYEDYIKEQEKKGIIVISSRTDNVDMPSSIDIRSFLSYFLVESQVRTHVTAPINQWGEITGYVFMRAKKELVSLVKGDYNPIIGRKLYDRANSLLDQEVKVYFHELEENRDKALKILKKIGLQIRFVPMPGYKFSEDKFVKKTLLTGEGPSPLA